jgi:phage baseplate assembly protein V
MALSIAEQLQRFIQPITRKIGSMICCALIKSVEDGGKIQLLKLNMYQDETKDKVERIQEFGFTSNPPDDSEAVVLFIGGNRSHGIVVATDGSKYRIKNLERGGVALYNSNGDKVVLTKDKIEVYSDSIQIGKSSFKKLINEEFKARFDNHVHFVSVSGTPAAQLGVSSSPAKSTGTLPIAVASVPGSTYVFADAVASTEMTSKTKAE